MEIKMQTKVIIIRHGQSIANAQGICLGHTDWDLTDEGRKQAKIAAEYLKDEKIDAIYSSDLIRAYNTALPHAQLRGMEIVCSKQLREIYLGAWECKSHEEMHRLYPEEFTVGWRQNFGICQVPGGESVPAAGERLYKEICRIAALHPNGTVLVASHAAAIRSFWGKVAGILPEELNDAVNYPLNASCTTVIFDGETLIPVAYSDAHYFDEIEHHGA